MKLRSLLFFLFIGTGAIIAQPSSGNSGGPPLSANNPSSMSKATGYWMFADGSFTNTVSGSQASCEGILHRNDEGADVASVEGTGFEIIDGALGPEDKAIRISKNNWLKIFHGINANGGGSGDWVNNFTVMMDVRISNADAIYSLFEVNPGSSSSGYTSEMEIEALKLGSVGAPASGADPLGFSDNAIEINEWYRISYVAKLGEYIKIYVDGVLWNEIMGDFTDARPSAYGLDYQPENAAFKVGGNNETDRDDIKDIDAVMVFNDALSAEEVAEWGSTPLGLVSFGKNEVLRISPNPTSDFLNFSIDGKAEFRLINSLGQTIHSTMVEGNSSIDIRNFKQGMYFIQLKKGNSITTAKVIFK